MFNTVMIETIDCPQAKQLVEEADAQLIDVRSPEEHAKGTIPGSINIPLEIIHQAHDQIKRERPVIVYCRSGRRSAMAKTVLENFGFDGVHNLGSVNKYLTC
ncbi:MAG: hypothetical protein BMS9Abin33_1152 [Gammaproteobacteria bacterium]|nr:MAG: hypothetical protein BMS9Abin33_1152 [Gammaproteobacteria bacterium]